ILWIVPGQIQSDSGKEVGDRIGRIGARRQKRGAQVIELKSSKVTGWAGYSILDRTRAKIRSVNLQPRAGKVDRAEISHDRAGIYFTYNIVIANDGYNPVDSIGDDRIV